MSTDVKLSKLIITRYRGRLFAISYDGNSASEIEFIEDSSLLGSVHLAKVKRVSKNINSAFLEIVFKGNKQMVFFSLSEFSFLIFADDRVHTTLHEGDDVLIKISGLPIKSKLAKATANIEISDSAALAQIMSKKNFIKAPAMLYSNDGECIDIINDRLRYSDFDIVTDDIKIYSCIVQHFENTNPDICSRVKLYQDSMIAMNKLYSLETLFDEALQKRVWLKNGGYLVIEPTEALTVIDVNTGKNNQKKELETVKLNTNLLAIKESARQLRLRNISGIIVIDLINTADSSELELMYQTMKEELKKDRITAVPVDITKLCLFEITRKKQKPSLYSILKVR